MPLSFASPFSVLVVPFKPLVSYHPCMHFVIRRVAFATHLHVVGSQGGVRFNGREYVSLSDFIFHYQALLADVSLHYHDSFHPSPLMTLEGLANG